MHIISGNNITNNNIGIHLVPSSNNSVYHNNFIGNTEQVHIYTSLHPNSWDNGYPSGGLHWSDHNPLDLYSGPFQNETGRDKIGDLPYVIDGNNTDRYPLIYPHGYVPSVDSDGDGFVTIADISVAAVAFGSFPGHSRWNSIADLNKDGWVDISDIAKIAVDFGKTV